MGAFDSLGTLITDLANATLNVLSVVFTGENATVVLTAVVVLALVGFFMELPQKLLHKYFKQ
jgi:hypothetical protein